MVLPHDGSEPRRRFTADEVMRMVRAGILDEDDRLELIDGELLLMSPQDPPHASTVDRLVARLRNAFGDAFRVRPQLPLQLSEHDMPEPDVVIARGDEQAFSRRHPTGTDTLLVVEVSDSSKRRDLRKAGLYAAHGVPCYWRLDVEARRLEVYARPERGNYADVQILAEEDEIAVPDTDVRWKVSELLPVP